MTTETVAVLMVLAMAPLATVSAVLYSMFFPWRHTREGWAFFNVIWSMALLVDVSVFYYFAPTFPGKPIVQLGVFAVILAGLAQLTYSLGRLVWKRRKARS